MKIHVTCECGRKLAVDEAFLGKQVRCPVCRHTFVATAADEVPPGPPKPAGTFALRPEDEEPAPKRASARRRAEEDEEAPDEAPRRRRRAAEEDEDDEKPVRRKRRQPAAEGGGFWHNQQLDGIFVTAGIVLLILGGVGIYMGIQNLRLAATASDTPQTLPLSQLIANGPGDNAHVIITDFIPANNYVYTYQKSKYESVSKEQAEGRNWNSVYIPVVPLTPDIRARIAANQDVTALLQPRKVQVIVIPKGVSNKATTMNWARGKQRIQGMVVNLIQSLDSQAQKLLKDSYPDTDFSRCWILKEGETPARAGMQLLLITGSTLGIVLSAFYFIVRFIKRRQVA